MPARPTVPALIQAVGDRSNEVRVAAISALAEIGPAARAALPALTVAEADRDGDVKVGGGICPAGSGENGENRAGQPPARRSSRPTSRASAGDLAQRTSGQAPVQDRWNRPTLP
jgi:hypothetical protein